MDVLAAKAGLAMSHMIVGAALAARRPAYLTLLYRQ